MTCAMIPFVRKKNVKKASKFLVKKMTNFVVCRILDEGSAPPISTETCDPPDVIEISDEDNDDFLPDLD